MESKNEDAVEKLWSGYLKTGNQNYRDLLIDHYLYLVKLSVGKMLSYLPSHIALKDLYSFGVSGLIKAVEKFDVQRNKKFEHYACFVIKAAIIDELRKADWVPRSVYQKANKIKKSMEVLRARLGREPFDKEIAEFLTISENELMDWFIAVRPISVVSLNQMIFQDEDSNLNWEDKLVDSKAENGLKIAEKKEYSSILARAIEGLDEKEKQVLKLYYYDDLVLKEIANVIGVTESRISQIHSKALIKLKSSLKSLFET